MAPVDLTEIVVSLATQAQNIETILDKLDRVEHAIYGNGREGMAIRVDRLEQIHTRFTRWTTAAIGSAIAAVISLVTSIIKS